MSGGEPSSIKQKPSCAAELPILSPKCGKAAGCVFSNCLRAVLWSTERKYRGLQKSPIYKNKFLTKLVFDTRTTRSKIAESRYKKSGKAGLFMAIKLIAS